MTFGNRIVILGCPGSGKSTFARKLHERTGLPLIYLDRIWWRADRSHISREEFDLALIGTKGKWYDHKVKVTDVVKAE